MSHPNRKVVLHTRRPHKQNGHSQIWDSSSYFICKGTHKKLECLQKVALYAFQEKLEVNLEVEYEIVETEILLVKNVEHLRMRGLKYLFALKNRVEEIEEPVEHDLMYVKARDNHRAVRNTIIDSRTTHNFLIETEAKRLNIAVLNTYASKNVSLLHKFIINTLKCSHPLTSLI